MPIRRREWIRERKVCDSTVRRPRSASGFGWRPDRTGEVGVVRHQRIDAEEELRALLQRDGGVQRLLQRAIDVVAAVDARAADRGPGSAALAFTASEIGT